MTNDAKRLMEKLRALDFSLTETALYLDAYPACKAALDYYHKLCEQRDTLAHEYERRFGPLTQRGNENKTAWDWTKTPFPWEYDAN